MYLKTTRTPETQMPLEHKPWDCERPLKSFVVFITHTGIFLCPITSSPSVLLLGIFRCQIHSTLQSNWFHLNFSRTSNKHRGIDETSDVSELSVFICKVKLIFFIYFIKDLREREKNISDSLNFTKEHSREISTLWEGKARKENTQLVLTISLPSPGNE